MNREEKYAAITELQKEINVLHSKCNALRQTVEQLRQDLDGRVLKLREMIEDIEKVVHVHIHQ